MTEWLDFVNNNKRIERSKIHIALLSPIFGIVPLELSETFPLAQFEFSPSLFEQIKKHSLKMLLNFFKTHEKSYYKCAIMIPDYIKNQFNEQIEFKKDHPVKLIKPYLEQEIKMQCVEFKKIEEILKFFSKD